MKKKKCKTNLCLSYDDELRFLAQLENKEAHNFSLCKSDFLVDVQRVHVYDEQCMCLNDGVRIRFSSPSIVLTIHSKESYSD